MTFQISLTLSQAILIAISILLFISITVFCSRTGLFENNGGYAAGLDGIFILLGYALGWAIPSLLMWAVYATWFKG